MVPESLQYLLRKSGYASKASTSQGSSKLPSKRMGYQYSESGVELVDVPKANTHIFASGDETPGLTNEPGKIHRKTDFEAIYSKDRDASDVV